jgi:hypothetical protein
VTSRQLPPGAYDSVINWALGELLETLPAEMRVFRAALDHESAPDALARIIHDRQRKALTDTPDSDGSPRLQRQIALTNELSAIWSRHRVEASPCATTSSAAGLDS